MSCWSSSLLYSFFSALLFIGPFSQESNHVGQIELVDKLNHKAYVHVKCALEEFKKKDVKALIFHIGTKRGDHPSAKRIVHLIKKFEYDTAVPTIAYIDECTLGVGAEVAKACSHMMVTKEAVVGGAHQHLFVGSELLESGIADCLVDAKDPVGSHPILSEIPHLEVETYKGVRGTLYAILRSPIVWILLLAGSLLGLGLEISSPGFGWPGISGIACMGLMVLPSTPLEGSGWIALGIIVSGIGLFLIEMFILPGFGLAGAFGVLFFLGGFTLLWGGGGGVATARELGLGMIYVCIAIVLAIFASRYLLKGALVLEQTLPSGGGSEPNWSLMGLEGIAKTPLRPSGKIFMGEKLYDVVTNGAFIAEGSKVKVIRVEGSKIVVKGV